MNSVRLRSLTLAEVQKEHVAFVRNLLKPHVPSQDLPDLVQMSFIEIHRGLSAYDRARPIQPWLATIVLRTVQRHRRRAAIGSRVERSFYAGRPEVIPSGEERVEARNLLPQLLACLKKRQL